MTIALDQVGPPQPRRAAPLRDRAGEWLARFLAAQPQRAVDVYSQGRAQGFGRDVLRDALTDIGGLSIRTTAGNRWHLEPEAPTERTTAEETRPQLAAGLPAIDFDVQQTIEAAMWE